MDIRSFELNYEINTLIYDEGITQEFNKIFSDLLISCTEFNLKEYESRSLTNKLIDGISRLLSSIL